MPSKDEKLHKGAHSSVEDARQGGHQSKGLDTSVFGFRVGGRMLRIGRGPCSIFTLALLSAEPVALWTKSTLVQAVIGAVP